MIPSLLEALRAVPDHRGPNTIHPLESILAMAVCAMLCGRTSELAITEWGESQGERLAKALGFSRPYTPCNSTLHYILRKLNVPAFQAALNAWLASQTPAGVRRQLEAIAGKEAIALDGKTQRGARILPNAPGVALVAAFSHQGGQVLEQESVVEGDELQAVRDVLERLELKGRIVTGDALQTQRDVTLAILEKKGTTFSRSKATRAHLKHRSRPNSTTPRESSARQPRATRGTAE